MELSQSEHPTTSPGPEEQTKTCQIHGTCNEYYQTEYSVGFVSRWHSSRNMLRLTRSKLAALGRNAEIQRGKTGVPGLEIASVNGTRRQATGPSGAMMSSTEARILCLHSGHFRAIMLTTLFRGTWFLLSTAIHMSATGTCCKYADLTVDPRSRRNNRNMQKPAPNIKSTSVPILPFCCLKDNSVATCKLSVLRDKSPANIKYTRLVMFQTTKHQ